MSRHEPAPAVSGAYLGSWCPTHGRYCTFPGEVGYPAVETPAGRPCGCPEGDPHLADCPIRTGPAYLDPGDEADRFYGDGW